MQLHFDYFVGQVCLLLKQASPIIWSQFTPPFQHQADEERSGDHWIIIVLLSLMDQEKPTMKRKLMEGASNQISKKLVF